MKAYGFFGWKEFNRQRTTMLSKYFDAKGNAENHEVQTEHGVAAEAIFREFLKGLLPKRFDVTSGYIIPDLLAVSPTYVLPHFDVIIYDALESPVLSRAPTNRVRVGRASVSWCRSTAATTSGSRAAGRAACCSCTSTTRRAA
jgi:hypothetical protein